jgi:hypothetical protein
MYFYVNIEMIFKNEKSNGNENKSLQMIFDNIDIDLNVWKLFNFLRFSNENEEQKMIDNNFIPISVDAFFQNDQFKGCCFYTFY